jgi:hypothetical protein
MTAGTGGIRGARGRFRRTPANAARDMRAAELHGQGWTHQRIAAELGYGSRGRVSEAITRAYAMIPTEAAQLAKQTDLDRIDRLIEQAWAVMLREHLMVSDGRVVRRFIGVLRDDDGIERLDADGKTIPVFEDILDDGPILAAIRVIERLIARREAIIGYGAPARSRVEVITADMVEARIAELEGQLAGNDPAAGDRSTAGAPALPPGT